MVTIAQEHENDREAIAKVMAFAAESLQTSRVELCSADAGPATAVMSVGSGLATQVGARVLEAGIAIGPEVQSAGGEMGVPIRLGLATARRAVRQMARRSDAAESLGRRPRTGCGDSLASR